MDSALAALVIARKYGDVAGAAAEIANTKQPCNIWKS
jgi:hypothetical protein